MPCPVEPDSSKQPQVEPPLEHLHTLAEVLHPWPRQPKTQASTLLVVCISSKLQERTNSSSSTSSNIQANSSRRNSRETPAQPSSMANTPRQPCSHLCLLLVSGAIAGLLNLTAQPLCHGSPGVAATTYSNGRTPSLSSPLPKPVTPRSTPWQPQSRRTPPCPSVDLLRHHRHPSELGVDGYLSLP